MIHRRFLLFPGNVHGESGAEVRFVSAAELAAAHGLTLRRCRVFDPTRPTESYAGLTGLWPRADGVYPNLGGRRREATA